MRTNVVTMKAWNRRVRTGLTAGCILAAGFLSSIQAAPKSPDGTWDCAISGSGQQGIAFRTFTTETAVGGSFSGYRLLVGTPASTSTVVPDARSTGGDDSRGGPVGTANVSTAARTNLYGFDRVSGPWQYDISGRIIGRFAESIGGGVVCTTNDNIETVDATTTVPVTNPDGSVTYYTTNITIFVTNPPTITCVTNTGITNGVSFVGTVVPARRLSIVASTANGKIIYSGIPYRTNLNDLSGDWYATETKNGASFLDLFSLTSFADGNPFPSEFPDIGSYQNIYFSLDGTSPTDEFTAISVLSARNKVGFAFIGASTNATLSSTIGPVSFSKTATVANTKGAELDQQPPTPIHFKAVRLPPAD